jgi:hypothetical protein
MDTVAVVKSGTVVGTGRHEDLLRQDDDLGDLYRAIVSRTISTAEPAHGEDLDAAWTGSIDTLWNRTHPVRAVRPDPAKAPDKKPGKKPKRPKKPPEEKPTKPAKSRKKKGDSDVAADR